MPKSKCTGVRNSDGNSVIQTDCYRNCDHIQFIAIEIPVAFGRTKCRLEIGQLFDYRMSGDQTEASCPNSKLVQYSDIHCTYIHSFCICIAKKDCLQALIKNWNTYQDLSSFQLFVILILAVNYR